MTFLQKHFSIRFFFMLLVVMLLVVAVSGAEQVNVPDPSIMIHLVPAAAQTGAPPCIKPGTRLTYYGMSAGIRGEYSQLVQDENGNWVNKTTGQHFRHEGISSTSGAGFSVIQVGRIADNLVQLSSKLYTYDVGTRQCMFSMNSGLVAHAGCAADYWIHPDVLKQIREMNQQGVRIVRMPYTVNGKTYKTIRFQKEDTSGYNARVYDLETGLLVYHASRAQGAPVLTPPIGNSDMFNIGKGTTQLINGWIVDVKDIDVPWKNAPAPQWAGQFNQLSYSGAQSTMMPMVGSRLDRPLTSTITTQARGPGWVRYKNHIVVGSLPGMPPELSDQDGASGNATIGGLWIPPDALADLTPGRVLDTNPHVGTTTTISNVMPGYITISEAGPVHRIDYTYDKSTGIMSAMMVTQQLGVTTITHSIQLTGQQ